VLGTIKDVVDERRARGEKIGVLGITSFRPFPLKAVEAALGNAKRFVCLEKAFSVGIGGIVSSTCAWRCPHTRSRTTRSSPASAVDRSLKTSLNDMLDQATATRWSR
jgi:pyruvate ferredoxin oxidoreductase alpha subunit